MAGYSEKEVDSTEEIWKPPTEAEMKVIQARRERSDRISKVMGSYLLKGYKMLASECGRCGVSVLMRASSRGGAKLLASLPNDTSFYIPDAIANRPLSSRIG